MFDEPYIHCDQFWLYEVTDTGYELEIVYTCDSSSYLVLSKYCPCNDLNKLPRLTVLSMSLARASCTATCTSKPTFFIYHCMNLEAT